MGLAMPSCPGQQAMQQQIDTLSTDNTSLRKTVMSLDGQMKSMNTYMDQNKQVVEQMSSTILAQKTAMDQMNAGLKDLQTKMMELTSPKKTRKKKH
jgi:uncharacterized coiled-coil protein SlyX